MATEEKNEIYRNAFKCIFESGEIDKNIFSSFQSYEEQWGFLKNQPLRQIITQEERELLPSLTLDEIAHLKKKQDEKGRILQIEDVLKEEAKFQRIVQYTIDEKSKLNKVFENLSKAIEEEKNIIRQIKALKRKQATAIIGKDHDLISGIVTYLWLTHPYNSNNPPFWLLIDTPIRQYFRNIVEKYMQKGFGFVYTSCNGYGEEKEKEALSLIQDELTKLKRMAFIRNISVNPLNMLVGMVKDGFIQEEAFIISTDNLPGDLKDQFEIIELEPEKPGVSVETPRKQEVEELFYDDAKAILFDKTGRHLNITQTEQVVFDFLKKGEQSIQNIIDKVSDYTGGSWRRSDFDPLKSEFNKKYRVGLGIKEDLIKNKEKGTGIYYLSKKIKDKKFKK